MSTKSTSSPRLRTNRTKWLVWNFTRTIFVSFSFSHMTIVVIAVVLIHVIFVQKEQQQLENCQNKLSSYLQKSKILTVTHLGTNCCCSSFNSCNFLCFSSHKPMFQNKECDASVGSIAKAFVPTSI